jgi:predicted metal-dependent peptidase
MEENMEEELKRIYGVPTTEDLQKRWETVKAFYLKDNPAFAITILDFKEKIGKEVDTAGINNSTIYISETFLKYLPMKEMTGIITHELMHYLLDHFSRGTENHELNNIAGDLAINTMIEDQIKTLLDNDLGIAPGWGMFKDFPKGLSMEDYIKLLKNSNMKFETITVVVGSGGGKGGKEIKKIRITDANGNTKEVSINEIDKELADKIRDRIEENIRKYGTGGQPDLGKKILEMISKCNWRAILKKYIRNSKPLRRSRSWSRENRVTDLIAGRIKNKGTNIVVVIDVSGSMDSLIAELIGELKGILKEEKEVRVIEAHDQIYKEYPLSSANRIKTIQTGGGTSFIPALERADQLRADVVIYLSDLEGEYPEWIPKAKVIWTTFEGNKVIPPFGLVVEIPK